MQAADCELPPMIFCEFVSIMKFSIKLFLFVGEKVNHQVLKSFHFGVFQFFHLVRIVNRSADLETVHIGQWHIRRDQVQVLECTTQSFGQAQGHFEVRHRFHFSSFAF